MTIAILGILAPAARAVAPGLVADGHDVIGYYNPHTAERSETRRMAVEALRGAGVDLEPLPPIGVLPGVAMDCLINVSRTGLVDDAQAIADAKCVPLIHLLSADDLKAPGICSVTERNLRYTLDPPYPPGCSERGFTAPQSSATESPAPEYGLGNPAPTSAPTATITNYLAALPTDPAGWFGSLVARALTGDLILRMPAAKRVRDVLHPDDLLALVRAQLNAVTGANPWTGAHAYRVGPGYPGAKSELELALQLQFDGLPCDIRFGEGPPDSLQLVSVADPWPLERDLAWTTRQTLADCLVAAVETVAEAVAA